MNKLQSFFITCRAFPFGRFLLLLLTLGGVGIGGHAIFGAVKGCVMKPKSAVCEETVERVWASFGTKTCGNGARMVVESDAYDHSYTIIKCVCDRTNEVQKDAGN